MTKNRAEWLDIIFGVYPFNFVDEHAAPLRSAFMEQFVNLLLTDFDNTIAAFERAAAITDPVKQLSEQAHFREMTRQELERAVAVSQQRESERKKGSNQWLGLLQGIQATQLATAGLLNSSVAVSSGNSTMLATGLEQMTSATIGPPAVIAIGPPAVMSSQNYITPSSVLRIEPNVTAEATNRSLTQAATIKAQPYVAATTLRSTPAYQQGVPNAAASSRNMSPIIPTDSSTIKKCVETNGVATCNYLQILQTVNGTQEKWLGAEGVCPSTGRFISGTRQNGDVSVTNEYPCTPGTPIAQIDVSDGKGPLPGQGQGQSGGGNLGNKPVGGGSSTGIGQSGLSGNGNPHHLISPRGDLQQCVAFDLNNDHSWDRYSNNCLEAVNVTVVFQDGRGGASTMDIAPGKTGGLARSRQEYDQHGGSSYYVCPSGYGAADVGGNYLYKTRVTQYMCRQHGW